MAESIAGWKCMECSHFSDEAPMAKLRECSRDSCGERFVSEERNCPQCNNPFTRVEAEHGCEECGVGETEEVEMFRCQNDACPEENSTLHDDDEEADACGRAKPEDEEGRSASK